MKNCIEKVMLIALDENTQGEFDCEVYRDKEFDSANVICTVVCPKLNLKYDSILPKILFV